MTYDHTSVILSILRFLWVLRRAREVFNERFLRSLKGFYSKLPRSRITVCRESVYVCYVGIVTLF
ncbi:hypothetical protein K443DRAFT_8703 [Laccaria amethystina LaAM-08-1]|uniref:Uncharacterized protein n=1 Tax=Laccaria amethystina LaAM-08-1 TaxID=1095629 RepID=A0A0C9WNF1_9AGAR|nr:hypothetical protein K443DRAFT_8703 [Laccaria amethystina LaAM-08-1]